MNKLMQQLTVLWGRLLLAQKVTMIMATVGLLAVLAAIMYGASRPDYRLLVRDLTRGQVAEIASYLDGARVPYQVTDGESAILVPTKDLYRLRNELAQRSLLGDGVKGFELLDGGSMWDSTFREHRTYDRAVAGELERSFREMPGIKSARVLIDRPAPSPFMGDDDAKPRASVKVALNPGARLTDRQIAGIIHLTSGAVAGLPPENVQIMDGGGLLTPQQDEQGVGMANTVLEAEASREAYLTRKAQEILDATLGRGRSQVKVAVKMDFSRRTEASTNPDRSVVLKEQTTTLDETTPVFAQAGVAGTASNVESADSGTTTPMANARKASEEARNEYVVGNRTITQEDEVGRIRAMSVSILVDHRSRTTEAVNEEGQPTDGGETVWEPVPAAELEQYKDLVLNAIGFHAARGSQPAEATPQLDERFKATVQSIRMVRDDPVDVAVAAVSMLDPDQLRIWIGYGAAALAAVVFLLLARGQLRRSQTAWTAATERHREEVQREAAAPPVPEAARDRRESLREDLARRIQEDPALAATIVRKWIHGEA